MCLALLLTPCLKNVQRLVSIGQAVQILSDDPPAKSYLDLKNMQYFYTK